MVKNIEYDALDRGVVDMVRYFNDVGLPTKMSCEGHNETNMSMFWIEFATSVTEDDIAQFQKRHYNRYKAFTSNGRFVMRVYSANGTMFRSWQYMAATKKAADADLRKWVTEDAKEVKDA